jgi:hypothetical protein
LGFSIKQIGKADHNNRSEDSIAKIVNRACLNSIGRTSFASEDNAGLTQDGAALDGLTYGPALANVMALMITL